MINSTNNLIIFSRFEIDYTLLKYKNNQKNINHITLSSVGSFISDGEIIYVPNNLKKNSFKIKQKIINFLNYLNSQLDLLLHDEISKNKTDVISFFEHILGNINDSSLIDINDVIGHYNNILYSAELTNQVVLIEKIKKRIELVSQETKLLNTEFTKFIKEDDIVNFYNLIKNDNSLKKTLKMSWIKNYTKPIPEDIVLLKIKADQLLVFDNYVILHFDPNNQNVELTSEEKAELADPILFGVISNSTKLYYIGDWIDEDCDLTLDKLIEMTDKKIVNNINVQQLKYL